MLNSFSSLPYIPYNILVYLATNSDAENIWKMLKYSTYDALSKPNLTFEEKISYIWKNGPQENFGIFLTPLVEDEITKSKSIMKLYNYFIEPNSAYIASTTYAFDFLYGGNMALVEYNATPVSRGDLFIAEIMKVLNGAEIGGVGKLGFLSNLSRYDIGKSTIGNSRTFTGVQIFMTVQVGDGGVSDYCVS